MSTVVVRVDVTWTTTGSGGWTKTTMPPPLDDATSTSRTWNSTDQALTDIAEDFRKKIVQQVLGIDPNANTNCKVTTQTVT